MKVIGKVQVEIDDEEFGSAIRQKIIKIIGKGSNYIADNEWKVSGNPIIASLVDTANYLTNGKAFKINGDTGVRWSETI